MSIGHANGLACVGCAQPFETLDVPGFAVSEALYEPGREFPAEAYEGLVVSLPAAETIDLSSDRRIIATACHFIFFFANRASGERWVASHPKTMLLSLEEAYELAGWQNARLFGQELARRVHAA